MYPAIYRTLRLLWPGGLETRRHLKALERTQWLPKKELEALQLTKLQKLVRHAYQNVPFYREKYRQAGIRPDDIKTLADFAALPFLTRQDVEENLEQLVAQNVPRHKLIPNDTGGSTGHPLRFYIDDSFWWWNAANWFRARRWHGVSEGEKIAWFWGAKEDMPEWSWRRRLRSALMQERYLNAFAMTEKKMEAFATMLQRWQPAMYKGYASALTLFARFAQEKGITGLRPRLIESTSEKLSQAQKELLQAVFQCAVVDHYSSREIGTMAYECETGELLVCADARYLEIVANDQPVAPGQMGEMVVTSLNQFAMPFIRYKNRDLAIFEPEPFQNPRNFPVLREVVGRTNDFLVSGDGQFVHSEFFAYTFRVKPEVDRYQVYQPDPYHLDIRLTLNQSVDQTWLDNARAEVQDRFGPATQVEVKVVEGFELTPAGKHRYIISEVKPDFI